MHININYMFDFWLQKVPNCRKGKGFGILIILLFSLAVSAHKPRTLIHAHLWLIVRRHS